MRAKYMTQKEETCLNCDGKGFVYDPARRHEYLCRDCAGRGSVFSQVDLEVAMKELGFIVGLSESANLVNPEPCHHPALQHIDGSVEIPGNNPVIPVTILVCTTCGLQVVVPVILNACLAK